MSNWTSGTERDERSVVWIGRSFLPGLSDMVKTMVNSSDACFLIREDTKLMWSSSWKETYNSGEYPNKLLEKKYDIVILASPYIRYLDANDTHKAQRTEVIEYGGKYAAIVKKAGGTPIFMCPWVYHQKHKNYFKGMQNLVTKAYVQMVIESGAVLVPCGLAWKNSYVKRPEIILHAKDGHHPGFNGKYLTACVFYCVLTDMNPIKNIAVDVRFMNGECKKIEDMDQNVKLYLQSIAWETYQDFKTKYPELTYIKQ